MMNSSPSFSSSRLRASSSSAASLLRRRNTSTNSLQQQKNTSTLRDIQKQEQAYSPSSSPTKFLQQLKTIATFLLSLLLVRWIVFELRPFYEFRWTREIIVWIGSYRLFLYLTKRQNRRPLRNYGRWALVMPKKETTTSSKNHLLQLDTWSKALCARGMRVGVILEDSNDDESFQSTWHETVELKLLESWLGFKQWEGGVGVAVIIIDKDDNDGSSQDDYLQAIQRHMAFRHSGAIVRVVPDNKMKSNNDANNVAANNDDDDNDNSTDDPPFLYAQHGIVLLELPESLLSYSTVVDAALEKVGETKRLTTRHVLWQRVKQLWRNNVLSW